MRKGPKAVNLVLNKEEYGMVSRSMMRDHINLGTPLKFKNYIQDHVVLPIMKLRAWLYRDHAIESIPIELLQGFLEQDHIKIQFVEYVSDQMVEVV